MAFCPHPPPAVHGLAGRAESSALASLPPVPANITEQLQQLIDREILPAARDADWRRFSEAVYLYGLRAGECFAPAQGGPFASPAIAALVDTVRALDIPGVGQSSWGPTVFAITRDAHSAAALVDQLQQHPDYQRYRVDITAANNSGVTVDAQL